MTRLFDQALQEKKITAWVGASDSVSIAAVEYLREHGRTVPDDISVVGFDDSAEEFRHNLTSYNFNIPAVIHAMVETILYKNEILPQAPPPIVIEGFINVRGSSGRTGSN